MLMARSHGEPSSRPAASLLSDVVCNARFAPDESGGEAWHDMHVYHFCSSACREIFLANPDRFTHADSAAPRATVHGYRRERR